MDRSCVQHHGVWGGEVCCRSLKLCVTGTGRLLFLFAHVVLPFGLIMLAGPGICGGRRERASPKWSPYSAKAEPNEARNWFLACSTCT